MLRNFVGRRFYSNPSGGVTNDFLQQILERAKNATAAKANVSKLKNLTGGNIPRKFAGSRNRNDKNNRRFNRKPDNREQSAVKPQAVLTSTKENAFNSMIEQTQFSRKSADSGFKKVFSENEQLLDEFSSSGNKLRHYNKDKPAERNRSSRLKRHVPRLSLKSQKNDTSIVSRINRKITPATTNYVPQETTLHSLLRYQPMLSHSRDSRLISCAVETLKENSFPIVSSINLGFGKKNNSLTCNYASNVGSYKGGNNLKLDKERLFKNLEIIINEDKLQKQVLGKYDILPRYTKENFATMSNNAKKLEELERNSEIVRTSLFNNTNISNNAKALLLDICSGMKPISELSNQHD
ncbi:hypothetical protein TPHA_0A00630 [Tetrapisispora phaffii CBS 4417]|uniref:37S ribosomal protein RSM28, mitochondrial n=1 Tax=Tetrapisispora phaffii (strain ATCC 24235 / CBS 4417 / NBRC 1672 / NRRL Y-8282 / UCD 70-5) TaxID=1071381 RepID=G8BMM0_TETPH|nr:hypothetical protein TPHA_0A00630 [Tetrapisispora phaffii CBS 4417]CCE61148.1 hypothetical protein TPHA_0A00630 [Tetrapisispora phaffii CBS 4417]